MKQTADPFLRNEQYTTDIKSRVIEVKMSNIGYKDHSVRSKFILKHNNINTYSGHKLFYDKGLLIHRKLLIWQEDVQL